MKYYIKKDTKFNRVVSKARKRRIQYTFGSLITVITILAFFVNSAVVQLHPFEMKDFSLSRNINTYRTGRSVSFKWALMGVPEKLIIVFGDGGFQELSAECFEDNGVTYGFVSHIYHLQGKYTPILKAYYPSKTLKRVLDVFIHNEAPLFSFGFSGELPNTGESLHTGDSPFQTFEDDEVGINVNVTNNFTNETLTYQFNFGDSQIVSENNSITHTWENRGIYPVTVTVVGNQGELSKQTKYIDVINRRPNASIQVINETTITVGKEIEFTAEDSYDTPSDKKSLRYIWNWGDGLMKFGKIVSHTYYESGTYNVSLTVKDDDSSVDRTSCIITIQNKSPSITFVDELSNSSLIVNEGEEVLLSAYSQDDDPDIFKLLYYWNFDSVEFDPLSLESYQLGGWKNKHVFDDDFEGRVTVGVIDPANEFNSDSFNVQVLNVAPQIGLTSVHFIANVSFQVYRNDTTKDDTFTFIMFKDNDSVVEKNLSFSGSNGTEVRTDAALIHFDLANQWKIIVNSSRVLPKDSLYQASIKLTFTDGQDLVLNSDIMFGGSYGEWEVDLSSEFYDDNNYSYKYPISFTTQVFDPSQDEVEYIVSYQESRLFEITYSSPISISDSFISQGIEYVLEAYVNNSKQFLSVTAQKVVLSEFFDNHTIPLSEQVQIEIAPLVDIFYLIEARLGLSGIFIENCLLAENTILASAIDDDFGEDSLSYSFDSTNGLEMVQDFVRVNYSVSSVTNPKPSGKIGWLSNTAYEGESVKLTSETNDGDVTGMIYMWDFGDGTVVYSKNALHTWPYSGVYNVTLTIADPFGNIHRDQESITILPKAPEILGPFAFQGSEGSSIVLDVEIYDSCIDDSCLEYFWYNDKGVLVSQDLKPLFTLDDGTHIFTLKVVDSSGLSSSKNIVVTMHSLSPEVYISNYMYHGVVGEYWYDNDGKLELTAYGIDTLLDSEKLYFYWTIRNGKKVFRTEDGSNQCHSTVTFTCKQTTTYQGEVRIVDPEGNEKVATFQILSTIDSSLNGVDDETEEMLQNPYGDGSIDTDEDELTDTDGDGLTDTYEMTVSNTSYLDRDTDGDRLWDGWTVNGNVGEKAVSTDPIDWDSDNDYLSDGTEYFGYNITVVYFETTSNFHVTSDSLDNDTDNDGLSDYDEYYAGSHPRQADTDNDDLTDDIDPFPTNWDGDNDNLSDYQEILQGTDYNSTDTDQDGLKDGDEVKGWGNGFFTNPLEQDSDHDFVSDSAEIYNYLVKLQDEGFDDLDTKLNITTPVSLNFPHSFSQAVAAQISFGISFGEYGTNATSSYGIEDQDVLDLSIILVKKDDGVLLANFTTNNTRYFSQVVDILSIMKNKSLNYYGDYEIGIGYRNNGNFFGRYFSPDFEFPGDNWYDTSSTGCSAYERRSPLDGHSDVLVLEDKGSGSAYAYYDDNIARGHGTVQFYYRITGHLSNDGKSAVFYSRRDSSPYGAITLWMDNGKWYCRDGSTNKIVPNIPDPELDTWYDIKIDWCRDGTNWEGLSNKKFQITINGTSSGALTYYNNNNYDPTEFRIYTAGGHTQDYTMYYDALSFSWDEDYEEDQCLKLCPYNYNSTLDTDDVGCYLDYFMLDFSRYLDPNDNDYDDDGILDGVEMGVLVKGTDLLDVDDYYFYNNLTQNTLGNTSAELTAPDEYYLEIPSIGEVRGGQLDMEIKSNNTTEGSGKVFVQLIKEELNLTKSDLVLLDYCEAFSPSQQFSYQKSIDLSPYVTSGQVYGAYHLKVQAFSTDASDLFNLIKFEIETDTYVAAQFGDTEAYVTNPAESDTDGDTLSDPYEIEHGTNPISVDTDGDGVRDDVDRDPLRDVMIEIQPIYGQFNIYNQWPDPLLDRHPIFQIVINCSFVSEDYSIITPCEIATEVTSPYDNYYHRAYFTDYQYFINIDDDDSFYGDEVMIPLQLWEVRRHLGQNDVLLAGEYVGGIWYDFTDSSTQELFTVYNNHWVYVNFTLVSIEKANTFAIYDINSTFTGRYHDREQGYSIVQLQIPDDGHYLGTESFLEDQIGAGSTSIAFVDEDDSDVESAARIVEEIDGHTNVLRLEEGIDDHADITHVFDSSQEVGTIEWWWRTSDKDGVVNFNIQSNGADAMRLYMKGGKIGYKYGATDYDLVDISINAWYRMKIDFVCKIGGIPIYAFDIYVDGDLEKSAVPFCSPYNSVNNLRIYTSGAPFNSYFDAFGFSWDEDYDFGDNAQTYSVEGTPFEHGMNVIVVPTELFTHTLLNGFVENGNLYQTPLYHPDKNIFEISMIERNGQPTQANADADLSIYRRNISPSDAMEVLELVLKGLLNETWEQEDAIYLHSYICTKLNGTKATQMNLPYSVLGFIPWFNPYSNSKMGDEPLPSGGFDLFLWLLCLFNPVLAKSLHSQMAMTGGEYYKYLRGFTQRILMDIMTALGDLLWVIARTVLIVLFYTVLAIEIATTVPLFLILGVTFSIFSLLIGNNCDWGINIIVPYGTDTKIGFIDIDMSKDDKNLKFESWIKFIYWDFFDLYIPIPSMDFNIDIEEYFDDSPTDESTQTGVGTFLTCGYSQLDDYIFDFESTYWDNPNNAPPEYMKVVLLSPIETLHNYTMKVSPYGYKSIDYWEGREDPRTGEIYIYDEVNEVFNPPNWYRGVRFNVTIDFEEDFTSNQRNGQWYYRFIALADRDGAEQVKWPTSEEYAIGPFFNESGCVSMEDPLQYLQYEELNPFQGRSNEIFNFSVWWADYEGDTIPEEVLLILELPNSTIKTFEMANVDSYQVDYSIISDKGNVTYMEYKRSLNLSMYIEDEISLFSYCYKALLSNGNYSFLLDIQYVNEMGIPVDTYDDVNNATRVRIWFEGPLIFPDTKGKPIIRKNRLQHLTSNVDIESGGWINPIWEEHELVFWIYSYDPDRTTNYFLQPDCYDNSYPKVVLTNRGNSNKTITLDEFTWGGYDFQLDADKFWVKIGAGELGPGAWEYELIIRDDTGKNDIISKEETPTFWIVGSSNEVYDSVKNSILSFGFSFTTAFLIPIGISGSQEFYSKVGGTIATIALAVGFVASIFCTIETLSQEKNAGALIGLGWALSTIGISYEIGMQSTEFTKEFGLKIGKTVFNIAQILSLVQGAFLTASLFAYSVTKTNEFSGLLFYISDIFGLTAFSILMGIAIELAGDTVRKIMHFYSIALHILAIWSFIRAAEANEMFMIYTSES